MKIYIVDAFADRPLAGNPAAVCPLPAWPEDAVLQGIAAEMNLAETAFIVGAGGAYQIRWFTPTREVDLIGHATLAAAFIVFEKLEPGSSAVRFRSGQVALSVERQDKILSMDFPALLAEPIAPLPALARALGAEPAALLAAKHYLAVFEDAAAIRALKPDMAALAALPLPAVIVTAPSQEWDFVSRFFAPANGVPEDAVSGVAHLALVPYWEKRLGRSKLAGRQLSQRGGTVLGERRGDRVILSGSAVLVLDGELYL